MSSLSLDILNPRLAKICGSILELVPVTTGLSGAEVSILRAEGGEFILRRFLGPAKAWQHSLAMYQLASEAGVAPKIYYRDDTHQFILMQKINDASFAAALGNPKTRGEVGRELVVLLSKLQTIPCEPKGTTDLTSFATTLWQEQSRRESFPAWAKPLTEVLEQSCKALAADQRLSFCHGDLNPANILWDGQRLWVVDLDAAGTNHPFVDLATICNFLSMDRNQALGVFRHVSYTSRQPNDEEIFQHMRQLARIVYAGVFMRLIPDLSKADFKPWEEVLNLTECFTLVTSGKVAMHQPEGAGMIAAAFLKQAMPERP